MNQDYIRTGFFVTTLVFAAIILTQTVSGFLAQKSMPLSARWIKERPEHALRYNLPENLRPPPRFSSVERIPSSFAFQSYVTLNGIRLERKLSRAAVLVSTHPCYAWTRQNLWVGFEKKPDSATDEEHLAIVMPRPVPLLLCVVAALLPLAGWLLLSQEARRQQKDFLMHQSHTMCVWLGKTKNDGNAQLRATPWTACILITAFGLLAIMVSTDHGRPIWLDELLHFALGACNTATEAWNMICEAGKTRLNHGQTGIYMLLDYWLLKYFGASSFALRLPSLFSGVLLFFGAGQFLRARGFGAPWQLVVMITLVAQTSLVSYIAEARPYLPLAAASVGVLAYYVSPPALRNTWGMRALGIVSIGWGVLMHPYFSIYWLLSYAFGLWLAIRDRQIHLNPGALIRLANPAVSLTGVVVYFILGKMTWLHSMHEFAVPPFRFLSREEFWPTFVHGAHLQFLHLSMLRMAVLTLVLGGVLICLFSGNARRRMGSLLPPITLIVASMAASLLIAGISYAHHFAIIPRQWIASQAFIPIAFIWALAELFHRFSPRLPLPSLAVLVLLLLPIFDQSLSAARSNFEKTMAHLRGPDHVEVQSIPDQQDVAAWPFENPKWVALANRNIAAGGMVWPVFKIFYPRGLEELRAERPAEKLPN